MLIPAARREPGGWDASVDGRRVGVVRRQCERGLSAYWLEQIPGGSSPRPRCRAQAMIGDRAYDVVGVGGFVTRGDPRLPARRTESYGTAFDPAALLAYTLLHAYRNLPWIHGSWAHPPTVLPSLTEAWFGTA